MGLNERKYIVKPYTSSRGRVLFWNVYFTYYKKSWFGTIVLQEDYVVGNMNIDAAELYAKKLQEAHDELMAV